MHTYLLDYPDSETYEDSECPESLQMSDAQPPSSTIEPTPETTPGPSQHRLTIASLCNPMDEAVDIRQFQVSPLFDENLDAVHKPSWTKDSSCEDLVFPFYPSLLLTYY